MKNRLAILTFCFVLFGGFFIFQNSEAFNSFTQPIWGGEITATPSSIPDPHSRLYFTPTGGAAYNFATDVAQRPYFYATSTATTTLGTFSQISSVSDIVYNTSGSAVSETMAVNCVDGNGTHTGTATQSVPYPTTGPISTQAMNFTFIPPVPCDVSTLVELDIDMDSLGHISGIGWGATDSAPANQGIGIGGSNGGPVTLITTQYQLYIAINGSVVSSVPTAASSCGPTSWAVFGADFGRGFCEVVNFMFVPTQSALNQWTDTKTLMATKIPFSYFYDLTNTIETLPTSTTATITPLTITTGSGTPMHISFDAFSAATINQYTDSNSRSVVRTLIKYALYLAFIAMIILEVRHLFKSKNQGQ